MGSVIDRQLVLAVLATNRLVGTIAFEMSGIDIAYAPLSAQLVAPGSHAGTTSSNDATNDTVERHGAMVRCVMRPSARWKL